MDVGVLQEVNDLFNEINGVNILSIEFYNKIMRFLLSVLRIFNHNLSKKLLKQETEVGK